MRARAVLRRIFLFHTFHTRLNLVHQLSGRWKVGFALAVLTAASWGVLPIALTITLQAVDAYTITWFRFLTAALGLGAILVVMRRLPSLTGIGLRGWVLLLVALAALTGNFVLYLVALEYTSPTINQVVSQLSPLLLTMGGIVFFRERFSPRQWAGFALLLAGLPLFFNRRLPELVDLHSGLGFGVALLLLAAVVWATYGLAQKSLLKRFQSQQVLVLLYAGATLVLLPLAEPAHLLNVNVLQGWMLAFSCANTIVAYGSFAEALRHWEASRVGATLALTPLFTLATMWILEHWVPGIVEPERLNWLSVGGALIVVGGSMLCALGAAPAADARAAIQEGDAAGRTPAAS